MDIMFQIVEVNVEEVMTYFEKEMRKGDKSKHKTKDQNNEVIIAAKSRWSSTDAQ